MFDSQPEKPVQPDEPMVTITDEFIRSGATRAGGWTRAQLKILGVDWPPQRGWKYRVIGKKITALEARRFIPIDLFRETS